MGVKNLMKIIKKHAPNTIKYKKIDQYRNMILGIDANLMIYKMIYAIRRNGYDIMNEDNKVTHIHTMLQKLYGFKKYNILPIFVFDGTPPKIKDTTLKKREKIKKEIKTKYKKATTLDEQKKYYYIKSDITMKEINDCKKLITLFGYTYINSIEEADSQLAYLSKANIIDAVVTDDMDILVFGGKKILKNFTVSDKKNIEEIDLKIMLDELKITQWQLIDIAILLGCDYCKNKADKIGPMTALKLIKKHKKIENLDIKINDDYVAARRYFLNQDKNIKKQDLLFVYNKGTINYDDIRTFLKKNKYSDAQIKKTTNSFRCFVI